MTTRRARPVATAPPLPPPPVEEEKDPFLIGRFRFNPDWVHKEWSNAYFRWLVLVSCAVWYNLIFILPRAVFHEMQEEPQVFVFVALDYICDIVYLLDMGMRILTGYLDNGILIREPRKLFKHYIHSKHLKWDVISIIPTDLFFIYTGWNGFWPLLRINRIFRMGRVGEFKHRALTRLDSPNTFRLIYLILTMVVLVHLNACVYYFVSYQSGIGMDRWTYPAKAGWRYEEGHHGGSGGHEAGGGGHDAGGGDHEADTDHRDAFANSSSDSNEFGHGFSPHGFGNDLSDPTSHSGGAHGGDSSHFGTGHEAGHDATTHATGHGIGRAEVHAIAADETDIQDKAGGSSTTTHASAHPTRTAHPPAAAAHHRRRRQINSALLEAISQRHLWSSTTPTTTFLPPLPTEPLTEAMEHAAPGHGGPSTAHSVDGGGHGEAAGYVTESSAHGEAGGHGAEAAAGEHGAATGGGHGEGAAGGHGEAAAGGHGETAAGGHDGGEAAAAPAAGGHNKPMRFSPDFANDTLYQKYSYCMYWSVKMMTSKPYEISNPQTTNEFVFHLFDAFVGILLFASIVGEVDGIIESINKKSDEFKEHLDSVKQYISMRKVGKEMESRVVKWFDYIWSNNGSLNEESVLTVLPEKLRMEIAKHVHLDVLKKVPIFQGIDEQFLLELAEKLKFEAFCPGDYVCRRGDIGRHIYVVRRGLLNVIAADGVKVIVTLKAGVVFGELSLLNVPGSVHGNRRTVTVRSVGYADLYSLSKEDFWVSLEEYPEVKDQLMEKAKKILQKDNLINENEAREQARRGRNFQAVADKLEEGLETINIRMDRFWQEQIELSERLIRKLDLLEEMEHVKKSVVLPAVKFPAKEVTLTSPAAVEERPA